MLREAADQLEKAGQQLERGNRNLAEQLFSTAELLVGPEALAQLAPLFREGAPPRVTTPTQKVDLAATPQPKAGGSSEADDEAAKVPPPKVEVGSVTGTLQVDGKPLRGFGLVTLEPARAASGSPARPSAVVEQRGREFLPGVVAVPVGSTISFPNFDTVFHNVFSSPLAPFDLGLYKAGEAREFQFDKEGIIRLGCNLHANMSGYIVGGRRRPRTRSPTRRAPSFRRAGPRQVQAPRVEREERRADHAGRRHQARQEHVRRSASRPTRPPARSPTSSGASVGRGGARSSRSARC